MADVSFHKRFIHPGPECKCCHPELWVKHPSTQCTCCMVEWEQSGMKEPFGIWIQKKLDAKEAQAIKPVAKAMPVRPWLDVKDCNAVISTPFFQPSDLSLFCDEPVEFFPANASFADVLVKFGLFPSKGQAKKNGWDKPIPLWYSEWTIGKAKHMLTIWNPGEWIDPGE